MAAIVARIAYPCFTEPVTRPKVRVGAAGMSRMRKTSKRLESCVGFSKGWAELALK